MSTEPHAAVALVGTARYVASVGFGDVYRFDIDEVLEGSVSAATISLTVLPNDNVLLPLLRNETAPVPLVIRCTRTGEGEPHHLAPVTGFVDEEGGRWEVRQASAA